MKKTIAAAIALALVSGAIPSCQGVQVRDNAFAPVQAAWQDVRPDAIRGAQQDEAILAEVVKLDAALGTANRQALTAVDWAVVATAAVAGITEREVEKIIGSGVAQILREQVAALGEYLNKLKERLQ